MIAMGCASAQVIADSFYDQHYAQLLRKRWGLLLEVPYPDGMAPLRHGTMDMSYMSHYKAQLPTDRAGGGGAVTAAGGVEDITFTACTSLDGNLLLGALCDALADCRCCDHALAGSLHTAARSVAPCSSCCSLPVSHAMSRAPLL